MTARQTHIRRRWLNYCAGQLLDIVRDVAEAGAMCPTADELSPILGVPSNGISRLWAALESEKLIRRVQTDGVGRYIEILDDNGRVAARTAPRIGRQSKPKPVRIKAMRNCLRCGSQFASEGAGHRICRGCKSDDVWKGGDLTAPFSVTS